MAHNVNIVLFHLSRPSHLLTEIQPILESARDPCIERSELLIDGWEASQADSAIAQMLSGPTQDAMMLMLDSDPLERATALLPLLRKSAADCQRSSLPIQANPKRSGN